jgi:hypothetical protein
MGSKRLRVYRNGILLNTAGFGGPTDQYAETSSTSITLVTAALVTDVFVFHNMGTAPIYRQDISGVVGTIITVPTYIPGDKMLLVSRNGVLMYNHLSLGIATDRYQEASPTTIQLAVAPSITDYFTFIRG